MKLQPFQAQKIPINVENDGKGGCTQIIFAMKHANQARQVFYKFQNQTKQPECPSMAMDIDGDDSSVQQSNMTSYSTKMEAMLKDDAAPEFPPLTPPSKAGRRPRRLLHKKLKKMKARSQESDSDSDEDTREECQKKAKKKKAKTKTTEPTQQMYADVLSDDDISSLSKASTVSSELKEMFKSLMLDQQQEMTDRKWEQKAHALVIANLKHQNQVLQSQFEFLAMELD